MMRVPITATSFSEITKEPEHRLLDAGYELEHSPYGRPMMAQELAPLLKEVDAVAAGVSAAAGRQAPGDIAKEGHFR